MLIRQISAPFSLTLFFVYIPTKIGCRLEPSLYKSTLEMQPLVGMKLFSLYTRTGIIKAQNFMSALD